MNENRKQNAAVRAQEESFSEEYLERRKRLLLKFHIWRKALPKCKGREGSASSSKESRINTWVILLCRNNQDCECHPPPGLSSPIIMSIDSVTIITSHASTMIMRRGFKCTSRQKRLSSRPERPRSARYWTTSPGDEAVVVAASWPRRKWRNCPLAQRGSLKRPSLLAFDDWQTELWKRKGEALSASWTQPTLRRMPAAEPPFFVPAPPLQVTGAYWSWIGVDSWIFWWETESMSLLWSAAEMILHENGGGGPSQ